MCAHTTSWTCTGTARYSATCATRTSSKGSAAYASIALSAAARGHAPTLLPATISLQILTAPTYRPVPDNPIRATSSVAPVTRHAGRSGDSRRQSRRSCRQGEYGSVVNYLATEIRRVRHGREACECTYEY